MKTPNLKIMQTFTLKNIPDLDTCVLGALELFSEKRLPEINIKNAKKILVVGSGNALATGKIIFSDIDAIFESESTYKEKLNNIYDLGVIISASGGKHAPIIAKDLKEKNIKTLLLTNNEKAEAKKYADNTLIFPKQKEPYTYNTSTYLSMILAKTNENPEKIYKYLKSIDKLLKINLSKFKEFYFILLPKYDKVREMFVTKFDELFGPMLLGRVYTEEQTKHGKTVEGSKKELFISLGWDNNIFGQKSNRLNIPLPKKSDYGSVIAIGYYIIGKIQKANPPWFKKNIAQYTKEASKIFGQEIKPIVE